MNLHSNQHCSNCRFFIADGDMSRCAVPIWENGGYYREHYVHLNSWCALYEEAEEAKDESEGR